MVWTMIQVANAAQGVTVSVETGTPNHGVVEGLVQVGTMSALSIVSDCEGTAAWFPDLVETHLIAEWEGGYRCGGTTDVPWPLPDRTWELDVTYYPTGDGGAVASFALVPGSGNVQVLEGSYVLTPMGDGRTHVVYEAWVDVGIWVPEFVVTWATRRVLPGIIEGIERAQGVRLLAQR